MTHTIQRAIPICCLTLAMTGCLFSGASTEQETEAYVAEEHLHHEIPDHMPEDFPDAVREIRERDTHLREDVEAEAWEHIEHELPELIDIIGWLPKLAADSDLNRQEWEQVRDAAEELTNIYEPLLNASQLETWSSNDDARKRLDSILASFDESIEKYPQGFEKVLGEHDHHDHHHDHHDH